MKKLLALMLALLMLCGVAAAETVFPLSSEPVTLRIMCRVTPAYPDQDNSKVSCMIAYEQMTGVHIEWTNVPKAVFNNTLAATINDDELPDIIMKGAISNANANDWGSEGILVDLKPYLEEYAPNFYSLMKQYPSIEQAITNANGEIFGLPQVVISPAMRAPVKLWYNTKALAAAGYSEFPTTLEGLRDMLMAVKNTDWDNDGELNDVGLVATADYLRNYFYGSFGLRNRGAHHNVVDVDPQTHELRIFAQSENFRACMEYLADLYANGLIYQELFTTGKGKVSAQSASEDLSLFIDTTTFAVPMAFVSDWAGVPYQLEGPDGFAISSEIRSNLHSVNNFCVTDACEDVGLALRWVDYFYSEEGARFFLCGVENQDWEVKQDGTAYFTDAALATRTSDMTEDNFKAQFGMWAGGSVPAAFYDNLFGAEYEEQPMAMAVAMLNCASDVVWPFFNWTDEETKIINTVEADIKTFINNSFAQIVAGEQELTDSWWNNFVSQIDAMGAEKLLKVYEEAISRVFPDGNF